MKKWIGVGLAVVGLYFSYAFIQDGLVERKVKKRAVEILTEIASPWDASLMRKDGSEWLRNLSPTTPEKIAVFNTKYFGSLREIVKEPECIFQKGYLTHNPTEKRYWAICEVTARFDKRTATVKIRLIEEPIRPPSFFAPIMDSLKLNDFIEITEQ